MLQFEFLQALLLAPLPLLVYFLVPTAKINNSALLKVPFFNELDSFRSNNYSQAVSKSGKLFLLSLLWILLLIASARPVWLGDEIILPAEGRDLMLAVDVSGSMQRGDMQLNGEAVDRLSIVKVVLRDFISRRNGDRLGLVLFGTNAYLQTPLTFDTTTLEQFLLEAEIGIAGEATAIGDAIGLSIKRLQDSEVNSRVLILLTDGSNTAGAVNPLQAAKLAKEKRLKIYTVGIGADRMDAPGIFGTSFFSQTINPSADLDEKTLKAIAETTGGKYFRAKNAKDLADIYKILDELEPVESDHLSYRPKRALFHYFLAAAFIISMLYTFSVLLLSWWQARKLNEQQGSLSDVV